MSGEELPAGWTWATLGEVTDPVAQGGPSEGETFRYIDIGAVDNSGKRITEARAIPVAEAPSRARQNVCAGDVLVSMTRPNLNAVALVPVELDGAVASTGFCVLRARHVEPRWLFAAVRSPAFVAAMAHLVQGALYPAVRPADIRDYRIPIPPVAEQRRIVAKLDALLASSRAARAALGAVPALLERYRQTVTARAFIGALTSNVRATGADTGDANVGPHDGIGWPLTPADVEPSRELPASWAWVRLGDLVDCFDGQRIPLEASVRKKRHGPYPYYGASGPIDSVDVVLPGSRDTT